MRLVHSPLRKNCFLKLISLPQSFISEIKEIIVERFKICHHHVRSSSNREKKMSFVVTYSLAMSHTSWLSPLLLHSFRLPHFSKNNS